MRRLRYLLLVLAVFLLPAICRAQGGSVTLVRSSLEPLPACNPSTDISQAQPEVWDITSQQLKICTAPNVWTAIPNAAGTGTVSIFSVSGTTTPFFTTAVTNASTTPNLSFTITNQAANCVFAGPTSGGAAPPTCRLLTSADIPVIQLADTPLTTNGDLLTVIGGLLARLPQGGNGTFLGVTGGVLGFSTPSGAGNVTTTTATLNAVMLGGGGTAITPLASLGLSGAPLLSAGGAAPPAFGQLNLSNANAITGNLPITNLCSGTGASATTFLRGDCSWVAPSILWSQIQPATGNLSINNGANSTTFQQTTTVPWLWQNLTVAVHLTPQNSPILELAGQYFTGAVSQLDVWTMSDVLGTADNGTSTFTFGHNGTPGVASVSVPNLIITSFTTPGLALCTTTTGAITTGSCGGTSGSNITVNSGSTLTSPVNFANGAAFQGLTINAQNLSASNVTFQLAGTLAIPGGGTGQGTAIAAFNALTPMNTTGDQEIFNAGTAQRVAIGANGLCWVSNGTIPGWAACPGGFTSPMTTLGDLIMGGASGTALRLPGPIGPNGVPEALCSTPSGGLATAPGWCFPGVPVNVQTVNSYTLLVTDRASKVSMNFGSTVTFTLPNTSGAGFANNFPFVTPNLGSGPVNVTPNAAQTMNGFAAPDLVSPGWAAWIYLNNGATDWSSIDVPMAPAFPICTGGGSALNFTPATRTIGCNSSITATQVPFSGILSGTNNSGAMILTTGGSLSFTGGTSMNASGMTTANNWLFPVISGAAPTLSGAGPVYDPGRSEWMLAVSGATNFLPTIAGPSNPTAGFCAQWLSNGVLTNSSGPCGSGGGGGTGQIDYPVAQPTRINEFGFSNTAAVTVANSNAATSLIGASVGRQTVLSGSMLPSTSGGKTIKIHAGGTVGTFSSNFVLTVTVILGGQTLSSITAPTIASLSAAGWELNYYVTVNSLTTANVAGCMNIVGTSNAELIQCASNAAVGSLNFTSNQLLDVQVTWTTANAANTITVNSLVANMEQGI
jgi:hypothetical protein